MRMKDPGLTIPRPLPDLSSSAQRALARVSHTSKLWGSSKRWTRCWTDGTVHRCSLLERHIREAVVIEVFDVLHLDVFE